MSVTYKTGPYKGIPDDVLKRVRSAVDVLHDVQQRMLEARDFGRDYGDAGRYEAEVIQNRQRDVDWALGVLNGFRVVASKKGIRPETVICSLGGEPDLTPSEVAHSYIIGMGG